MLPELFLKIGKGGSGRIVFIEAVGAFLIDYRADTGEQQGKQQKCDQQKKCKERVKYMR